MFYFQFFDYFLSVTVCKTESHVISGGSDSIIAKWRDVTVEKKAAAAAEAERLALEEQKLANLLKADELLAALKLALKLERPLQVLKIVESEYLSLCLKNCNIGFERRKRTDRISCVFRCY